MLRQILSSLLFILLIFSFSREARADVRSYVWTYEYMTMPAGKGEFEYYLTFKLPDTKKSGINSLQHQLEFEYGLTSRLDIAFYQRFKQDNKKSETDSKYDGFKIRTRYRFAEKNEYPLDLLLYIEYIRDADFDKPNLAENKIILAKDLGRLNFSYNQIFKTELESDGRTEHEYALAFSLPAGDSFRLGIESKGNYSKEKYYLGPTIAIRKRNFWMALGVVLGLNQRSDDLGARTIFGINF